MSEVTPGIRALLGAVEVRVAQSAASFARAGEHPTVSRPHPNRAEIQTPGCTIGRGESADLQLVGPGSNDVSRRHLLLQPHGRQWIVSDCGSKNGTLEVDPETNDWRRLGHDFPIPIAPGMNLNLGGQVILRFDLLGEPGVEGTTTGSSQDRLLREQRVRPLELEELARALLAPRRVDRTNRTPPSDTELTAALFVGKETVHRRRRRLLRLPEIAATAPKNRAQLCDALERAFPYLTAPEPN
jgi:pSer/pThr/pTyr-binding forkhead associated (FHA) protein